MNEEIPNVNEPNQTEWQAPPIPEQILKTDEQPQMSEAATLGNIFFSPGETFEDLRRKPRFILATLIMIILVTTFNFLFINKIGFEQIVRSRLESNSRVQQMSAEDKQKLIDQQTGPIVKTISYVAAPIIIVILFLLGGLIYWLGANAMGGSATFLRGVSVWVYSSFPPTVVSMLANILILFLKSPDDIDIATSQSGLVHANPAFFMDTKTMPVLGALLGTFDVFFIWGWILAAIGLRIVGKISSGAAWAIVLIVALLNIAARVVGALFS
ncbi:MAG: Yip1 family protein [Pyrinomonadaceae bacterium]